MRLSKSSIELSPRRKYGLWGDDHDGDTESSLFVAPGSGVTTAMDRAVLHNPTIIALIALLLRCCVGLHPHSGQGQPPEYGEFEKQRKLMEFTVHVPMRDWYEDASGVIGCPPFCGYLAFVWGNFASYLVPPLVESGKATGNESEDARAYMHATVLICDVLIFFSALWSFCILFYRSNVVGNGISEDKLKNGAAGRFLLYSRRPPNMLSRRRRRPSAMSANSTSSSSSFEGLTAVSPPMPVALVSEVFLLILLQPSFVLFDHGHFAYTIIYLGLILWVLVFCLEGRYHFAAVALCLAINQDQVAFYFVPAVLLYLMGNFVSPVRGLIVETTPVWKKFFTPKSVLHLMRLCFIIVFTFVILWGPFCVLTGLKDQPEGSFDVGKCVETLHHIEDKVFAWWFTPTKELSPNVWSSLPPFSLVAKRYADSNPSAIFYLGTLCTMIAAGPCLMDLVRRGRAPGVRRLVWALFNSTLAFCLFSYNADEKSILLPVLPAALLAGDVPGPSCWFSAAAVFSMSPSLVLRDKLAIPYIVTTGVFLATSAICFRGELLYLPLPWYHQKKSHMTGMRYGIQMVNSTRFLKFSFLFAFFLNVTGGFGIAPASVPDLWLRIHHAYSSIFFFVAFVYSNWYQWHLPIDDITPDLPKPKPKPKQQ